MSSALAGLILVELQGIAPWSVWLLATAQTLLQEKSSDDIRGKIFGSLNMMINIASTAPIFVAGILADLLSVTKVIVLIGAAVVVYALLQLRMLRHEDAVFN